MRVDTVKLATAITYGFFVDMLNPKNRGPTFKFETFDVEGLVVANSHIYIENVTPNIKKELQQTARHVWSEAIKRSGLPEWIDKQK